MFVATISYVTEKGYKKTLRYANEEEKTVNAWLDYKLSQLIRLKCTNVVGSYTAA